MLNKPREFSGLCDVCLLLTYKYVVTAGCRDVTNIDELISVKMTSTTSFCFVNQYVCTINKHATPDSDKISIHPISPDLAGPVSMESLGSYRYAQFLINDYCAVFVYLLKK